MDNHGTSAHHHSSPMYFMGHAPTWYKFGLIIAFITNVVVQKYLGNAAAGYLICVEFIFTLALALKAYPLIPGGLLALQAVVLGLTSTHSWYEEMQKNFPVFLLLMFMVAAIYFHKELLEFIFAKLLTGIRSKPMLSVAVSISGALLSAFLDALTVIVAFMTACFALYSLYLNTKHSHPGAEGSPSTGLDERRKALGDFKLFLAQLSMHGAIGTMLGGITTMVGEPQNLLIAKEMSWDFWGFFQRMAPVSLPILGCGLCLTFLIEAFPAVGRIFGFGTRLPEPVRAFLVEHAELQVREGKPGARWKITAQATTALLLVTLLVIQWADVGVIGLTVMILVAAFTRRGEEHEFGPAFHSGMPFCALLGVFFAIVGVIHDQHLFEPITRWLLSLPLEEQVTAMYFSNGFLSAVSDNVFVATVYIAEAKKMLADGQISQAHLDNLAIAINMGTNVPSIATPNGQAAFLFLLTSEFAAAIGLTYLRMMRMALPFTIILSFVGWFAIKTFVTQ